MLAKGRKCGCLAQESIKRTCTAAANYVLEAQEYGASDIYIFATEAVRSAKNKEVFLRCFHSLTGRNIDVLSGETEATAALLGALSGFGFARAAVADLGGASLELSLAQDGKCVYTKSVACGTLALSEVANTADTANVKQRLMCACENFAKEFDGIGDAKLILTGGTACSLAAIAQNLDSYSAEKTHGYTLTLDAIDNLISADDFNGDSLLTRFNYLGKRSATVPYGAVMLSALMHRLNVQSALVSEYDIMRGYLITTERAY